MRCAMVLLLLSLALAASSHPLMAGVPPAPGVDQAAARQAARERTGFDPTLVRVSGEWALCDKVQVETEQPVRRRTGFLLMQRTHLGWKITAELAGGGVTTSEALAYHGVSPADVARLLPASEREAVKPVMAFLRKLLPERYPTGYLVEGVAWSGDWALCAFRHRASLKKPDSTGWLLLRRTDDTWHLVERSEEPPDTDKYGVPRRVKKSLDGEMEQP